MEREVVRCRVGEPRRTDRGQVVGVGDARPGAWRERAASNNGLLPDNVGPNGTVGELHDGNWFGGHYGWAWPHGLHSVEAAAMIAATNQTIVTGRTDALDLARVPLDTVIGKGIVEAGAASRGSMGWGWAQKMGVADDVPVQLVPYRHNSAGWFDFHPVPLIYPVWLWWLSPAPSDLARLASLEYNAGFSWPDTKWFHDKEEQGHEAPRLAYLLGRSGAAAPRRTTRHRPTCSRGPTTFRSPSAGCCACPAMSWSRTTAP